jgi:beta-galactosidase
MGVGGDNSWGARPLEKYRVPVRSYEWTLRLRPLAPDLGDPMDLARTAFPAPAPPAPVENRR